MGTLARTHTITAVAYRKTINVRYNTSGLQFHLRCTLIGLNFGVLEYLPKQTRVFHIRFQKQIKLYLHYSISKKLVLCREMTEPNFFAIIFAPSCLSNLIGRMAERSKATVCKTVGLRPT